MNRPLYANSGAVLTRAGHSGLWWDKFFDRYEIGWTLNQGEGKKAWLDSVNGKHGAKSKIVQFIQRQYELGQRLNAQQKVFKTDWHFATGLGLSHPVENGFAWHPTLGVPYLPASGVKGLLRGWVETWMFEEWMFDESQASQREAKIRRWFGCNEKDEEKAGDLIFFDAIPLEPVEVITGIDDPHGGKWYEQGDTVNGTADDAAKVPADWHSPVPVFFLVVKEANFLFQIAPRGNTAPAEACEAMTQLQSALEFTGAGAKTAVGYGQMSENSREAEKLARKYPPPVAPPSVIEVSEEEMVTMLAPPQQSKVQVQTESGEVVNCSLENTEEAMAKWQAGESGRLFIAQVTYHDGVAKSATWLSW